MNTSMEIVLAHQQAETVDVLTAALTEHQYRIAETCRSAACLVAHCQQSPPSLIITGDELPDGPGTAALGEISKNLAVPAILVLPKNSPQLKAAAPQSCVMGYLFEPVDPDEVEPTVSLALQRFSQYQILQKEVATLRQSLADRKILERAKGILMQTGRTEDDAWKHMRRMATDQRLPMVEVAKRLLAEAEAKPAPAMGLTS